MKDNEPENLPALPYNGMSLRDYFAGQALTGILLEHKAGNPEYFAKAAYDFADAMLKQREIKETA